MSTTPRRLLGARQAKRLLRETTALLRRNIKAACGPDGWPASGNNDVAEANITFALATAGANYGYSPVFEVCLKKPRGLVDMVMVDKDNRSVIAAEGKLLYPNSKRARSCVKDLDRMAMGVSCHPLKLANIQESHILLVSCWLCEDKHAKLRRDIIHAFRSPEGLERLKRHGGDWNRLADRMRGRTCACQKVQTVKGRKGKPPEVHFLGLVFW